MLGLKNDKMSIGAQTERICRKKSGHIVWKSLKIDENSDEEAENVKIFYEEEQKELRDKDIKKVHEDLAHISSFRLGRCCREQKWAREWSRAS